MLPVLIGKEVLHKRPEPFRRDPAPVIGYRQHLVAGVLDGPRLVAAYMAGVGGDDGLAAPEQAGYDYLVGLSAAGEEPDLQIVPPAGGAYPLLRQVRVRVEAVARQMYKVPLPKVLEHSGVGPLCVV